MTANKADVSRQIYQIKVTLRYTRPAIWRRLLLPADFTLGQLHNVLQMAMGWDDSHLHEFHIGSKQDWQFDFSDPFMGQGAASDERRVRLSTVLGKVGAKVLYTYDFGDSWEHTIVVEKMLPPEPGVVYPICVGGKRQGPPEDCGGIHGYYNLLEAIRNPAHEDHEEMLEWVGSDFDPEEFSVDGVNQRLAFLHRRRGKK